MRGLVRENKPKHKPFCDLIECIERQRNQENEFHLATILGTRDNLLTAITEFWMRRHSHRRSAGAASSGRTSETVSWKWRLRSPRYLQSLGH